jgi:hypothetical protein
LQQTTNDRETKTTNILKDLVQANACQEAQEIHEKLAADGAWLGHILTVPAPTTRGPSQLLM